jgi:hypothetical protein
MEWKTLKRIYTSEKNGTTYQSEKLGRSPLYKIMLNVKKRSSLDLLELLLPSSLMGGTLLMKYQK